jgi:hypothetical protein
VTAEMRQSDQVQECAGQGEQRGEILESQLGGLNLGSEVSAAGEKAQLLVLAVRTAEDCGCAM